MRILALDAALARCGAAVVIDDRVVAFRLRVGARGHSAELAVMAGEVLAAAGLTAAQLDGIGVTVGPGSFTGLRAAIALARGIGLAARVKVVGVTVAEAMAAALPSLSGRRLWVAIDSRRGRVFLHRGGAPEPTDLAALPAAEGRVAVAGDAAIAVASRLAARGDDVMLTDLRLPPLRQIAVVARHRLRGELAPLEALPLYVDAPEAKLPAGGLRPHPGPA